MTTLADWLEMHVKFVEGTAPLAPAGADLAAMFVAEDDKAQTHIAFPRLARETKDAEVAEFQAFLKERQMIRYAIVSAAWMVTAEGEASRELQRFVADHGTTAGSRFEQDRVEVYQITVGDREQSLLQTLIVERDAAGHTVKLRRLPPDSSATQACTGRMVDLLVERH